MKYTLLEAVQEILSALDSDDVSDISENDEAYQVALIVRRSYFDILSRADLPEHYSFFKLTETSSSTPTRMTLPTDQDGFAWVKYDCQIEDATDPNWLDIRPISLEDFLLASYSLAPSEDNVASFNITIGTNSIAIFYRTDTAPTVYTTYDDNSILFNAIDTAVDTAGYLRTTKTLCWGKAVIPFTLSNSFTPDLDDNQFALLLNEAKALAFAELKQTQHQKAEQKARQGWTGLSHRKDNIKTVSDFDRLPNYGRKR